MIQDIKKEWKFGLRSSKFLILTVSFLFFAILTPVMTKVFLPMILKSQAPGLTEEILYSMIDMTQLGVMRSYLGDIFEIGSIIVTFTLCGLMAQEIAENTLVLPICSGKRYSGIIAAKILVFSLILLFATTFALVVDYAYAGLLFSFTIGIVPVIISGLLQGLYMVFLLAGVVLFGTITKKALTAGFITLGVSFGSYFLGGLLKIHDYLPSGLLLRAAELTTTVTASLLLPLIMTVAIICVFMGITMMRLKTMEWNER